MRDHILFESEDSVFRAEIECEMIRFSIITDEDLELRYSLDVIDIERLQYALEEMKQRITSQVPLL